MKAAVISVWIFINLLCFGMCGYIYLMWSQYWMYIEKQRLFSTPILKHDHVTYDVNNNYQDSIMNDKGALNNNYFNETTFGPIKFTASVHRRSAVAASLDRSPFSNSHSAVTNIIKRNNGRPRFPNLQKILIEFDSNKYVCEKGEDEENCETKVREFKSKLLQEFHRVLMDESNVFKSGVNAQNPYNVQYNKTAYGIYREKSRRELLCELKKIEIRTVKGTDEPFASEGFSDKIPSFPFLKNRHFNTCAVVASAGALYGSRLGKFIDSHDAVLRFNAAPTVNFTEDVGAKTTVRIVNSQVVSKRHFRFLASPLYRNVSILAWDPGNYTADLRAWYRDPDFNLFPYYKRYLRRRPGADFHLLHPQTLWRLWDYLQGNSPYRIRKNPPSSGFLGVAVMAHHCSILHVLEYVPSVRVSSRCHYYGASVPGGCALAAWHPLAAEKSLSLRLNSHDAVLRFNAAPTVNFTEDVGAKTTVRIVNSQVVSKRHFRFLASPLYRNVSILAWDPGNYTADLRAWYRDPDFNLFPYYKRYLRRRPGADFHLLHPQTLWRLWDYLQGNSPYRIRKNPPSSGFLGVAVMAHHCSILHVLEYVPSVRVSSRCHYYGASVPGGCALAAWHPLAAEKSLSLRLSDAPDRTVFQEARIRVPGLDQLRC